jgi:hypothetical protein
VPQSRGTPGDGWNPARRSDLIVKSDAEVLASPHEGGVVLAARFGGNHPLPRRDAGDILRRALAQLLDEQSFDVLRADAPRRQLVAIPRFSQVRLASEPDRGLLDRRLERQIFERVQGVVVDEDADGPLRAAGEPACRSCPTGSAEAS